MAKVNSSGNSFEVSSRNTFTIFNSFENFFSFKQCMIVEFTLELLILLISGDIYNEIKKNTENN